MKYLIGLDTLFYTYADNTNKLIYIKLSSQLFLFLILGLYVAKLKPCVIASMNYFDAL